jgi:hypothetical protein
LSSGVPALPDGQRVVFALSRSSARSPARVFSRSDVEGDDSAVWLAMTIDPRGVEVALEAPEGSLRAIRGRLADPERALELTAALEALPEQFALTLRGAGDDASAPACRASSDHVCRLIDRAEVPGEPRLMWLGWSVPREVAVEHAASLDEQLEDALVALGVVFALLADGGAPRDDGRPSPERRRTSRGHPGSGGAAKKGERARGGEHREDDRFEADAHGDDDETGGGAGRAHVDAGRDGRDGIDEPADRGREGDSGAPLSRKTRSKPAPRPPLRRRLGGEHDGRASTAKSPRAAKGDAAKVEKGARVRVLDGAFAGKVGVVQELDGKGGARVMLGLLAVRLAVKDLATLLEGRARPLLSSSHRKPLPVRS